MPREYTESQRRAIGDAIQNYIDAQAKNQGLFVGNAFAHGRESTAELAGATVVEGKLDEARQASLKSDNFDLITGQAGELSGQIESITASFYQEGKSPNELESNLRATFGTVENSWRNIARDQVAKAQLSGRNTTYAQIGQTKCEVTCAPDACDECLPSDGDIVDVADEGARPQFHIQCACMDIPTIEEPSPADDGHPEDTGEADE